MKINKAANSRGLLGIRVKCSTHSGKKYGDPRHWEAKTLSSGEQSSELSQLFLNDRVDNGSGGKVPV